MQFGRWMSARGVFLHKLDKACIDGDSMELDVKVQILSA